MTTAPLYWVHTAKELRRIEATRTTEELVAFVQDHAIAHYEDGGWDVVVECYGPEEIAAQIGKATTEAGALAKFAFLIDVWADRQADARISAF
jgi:hypothetical protein